MTLRDLVKFGHNQKGRVQLSLSTVNTCPAAHFSQNWSNPAPTGRPGARVGQFVTRFTELKRSTHNIFYTLYSFTEIAITGICTFILWIPFYKKNRIYNTRVYMSIYCPALAGHRQVLLSGYHRWRVPTSYFARHIYTVLQSGHRLYTAIVIYAAWNP